MVSSPIKKIDWPKSVMYGFFTSPIREHARAKMPRMVKVGKSG